MNSNYPTKWKATMVADRFDEAYLTLRRLYVPGLKPKGYHCQWPELLRPILEILQQDTTPVRLGPPDSYAISRMEETWDWLLMVDDIKDRHIIALKAKNIPLKTIQNIMGMSRTTIWRHWSASLQYIAVRLNQEKIPVRATNETNGTK